MVFGLSSHRAEHWWFMNGGRAFPSDVQDPAYADFYGPAVAMIGEAGALDSQPHPSPEYLEDWLARTCELVDKYQPQLVWFDWWIGHVAFAPYLQRFAAYYYNRGLEWGKEVAINYKYEAYPEGTAILDLERGQLKDIRPMLWQNDTSVSKNSWGYVAEQDYKSASALIQDLVDVVSKNGALLLNIGPRPDGTIPEPEQAILLEIGDWLAVNGEAIYADAPVASLRRRPHRSAGGRLLRHRPGAVHRRGHPLHDQAGRAVRDLPGVAGCDGARPQPGRRCADRARTDPPRVAAGHA